jgi:hypothetical protein
MHSATLIAENLESSLVLLAGGAAGALGESLNGVQASGVVRDRGPGTAAYEGVAAMGVARWGHVATLLGRPEDALPYRRVLVTGGLTRRMGTASLSTVEAAEVLALDVSATRASERVFCDMPQPDDAGAPMPSDGATPRPDLGASPPPPPPLDAGPMPPTDGGTPGGG